MDLVYDEERFRRATEAFAAIHHEDPRTVEEGGASVPRSIRYHAKLVSWVGRLQPQASEVVRLAAHAQHIRRWTIPRSDYANDRTGYKRWRSALSRLHADEAGRVLREVGYDAGTIARVGELIVKKRLRSDAEAQLLEDAVCLTFLELEYAEFARDHEAEKVVSILRKTWAKMSAAGHAAALELAEQLPADARALVERAVAP
jgi:hypothetical protein